MATSRIQIVCTLALAAAAARGEILSTAYHPAETMDLTATGTVDWCVYRIEGERTASFPAADWKKDGAGIARAIAVRGKVNKVEATQFTGVGWGWSDGTHKSAHAHRQGDRDGMGIRAWLDAGSALVIEFAAPPAGEQRQAHVIARCDGKLTIVARQGDATKQLAALGGKSLGIAVVRYDGDKPLAIELSNPDAREQVVRGVAAALSGPADYKEGVPRIPTLQEFAAAKAPALGEMDYLKAATDFADCMLAYGRDRYGKTHSPLFAVLLTREKEPKIGPQPFFARPSPYKLRDDEKRTPFVLHDFNKCLNYPPGLGGEGPHKVTVHGCDVYEDRELYEMLIDLSRITGEPKYRAEAEKALAWWFTHTMGPAGLYPWGEHLGWDFEFECPTYFEGPSKHLYAACYHEIKDDVPFLDFLAALPAPNEGEPTFLERYALGVWNAHYWDKARAVYCRHGDYTGQDDRTGSTAGFPAHQGAHLRLWAATYLATRSPDIKGKMEQILNTVLDAQVARAKKFGFVPFTFDPDLKGKPPDQQMPGQSVRLAHHAAELSLRMKAANPALAAKLEELARLHLGDEKLKGAMRDIERYLATGDKGYLQGERAEAEKPPATVADLSRADTPSPHTTEILRRLRWFKTHGDAAYLKAAEQQARLAHVRFLDGACPLPKAYAGEPRRTVGGEPFPDFYFRGAGLMRAFALVGEALRRADTSNPAR